MWTISYVPTDDCVPFFRARAGVPACYEALSEHYYGNPNYDGKISAGVPQGATIPANTWVRLGAAMDGGATVGPCDPLPSTS